MVLGFKTHIKGKPTHFVQKILACNPGGYADAFNPKKHSIRGGERWKPGMKIHMAIGVRTKDYFQFNGDGIGLDNVISTQKVEIQWQAISCVECPYSHLHPLRWSPVVFIDRQLFYRPYYAVEVNYTIDFGKPTVVKSSPLVDFGIENLAKNDGFDSVEDFFKYFNSNFEGQIIHWTDERY